MLHDQETSNLKAFAELEMSISNNQPEKFYELLNQGLDELGEQVLTRLAIKHRHFAILQLLAYHFGGDKIRQAYTTIHQQSDASLATFSSEELASLAPAQLIKLPEITVLTDTEQPSPGKDTSPPNLQFFAITTIEHPFTFPKEFSSTLRTRIVLHQRLELLDAILTVANHSISDQDKQLLPILICPEDFFRGAELYDSLAAATCLDRDITYDFFATKMLTLSKKFSRFLLLPGSAYTSVAAYDDDTSRYTQNTKGKVTDNIKKCRIYAQNIAPVFHNGEWLRLIKKGGYLQERLEKKSVYEASDHQRLTKEGVKLSVPEYGEDTLDEIKDLVFLGLTDMAGEKKLLVKHGVQDFEKFHSQIFSITFDQEQMINFALEICRDHNPQNNKLTNLIQQTKQKIDLDCHIVVSEGTSFRYTPVTNGYFIQCDAEHISLSTVNHKIVGKPVRFETPAFINTQQLPVVQLLLGSEKSSDNRDLGTEPQQTRVIKKSRGNTSKDFSYQHNPASLYSHRSDATPTTEPDLTSAPTKTPG